VLSTPSVLVAPKEKEPLLLYIAATHQVISTVLVVERSTVLTHTTRSLLGGNHRAINKEQQNLDYGGANDRLRGWKNKCSRTRRSHDDRRNLDATISGIHDKQNTTQRHGRSKKNNAMIQGFRRITRKVI
jgi:hypothetical protein